MQNKITSFYELKYSLEHLRKSFFFKIVYFYVQTLVEVSMTTQFAHLKRL